MPAAATMRWPLAARVVKGMPSVELSQVQDVLCSSHDPSAAVLLVDIQFEVAAREVQGLLAFLLDVASQDLLEQMLAKFLKQWA